MLIAACLTLIVGATDGFSQAPTSDTIHVVPPTGEAEADRSSIQAAFDAVHPGGTVQFAPGTYLLGAGARLTVPDVTVLGHPDGTILRGCDPEAFGVEDSKIEQVVFGCTGLYVQAERQTIRGLTFEYTWHGIVVGPFPISAEEAAALGEHDQGLPPAYPASGQRIEGNTFRATPNGLRVLGTGTDTSVVHDNDFIDVFHAIGIYGAPLHFLDNRLTVEEPGRVPFSRHPGSAVIVSPGHTDCGGHVVAGNRIEGYPDPIYVLVFRGEGTCRGVEIRDNTIHAARVKVPEAWAGYAPNEQDSTMVGAPITLMNRREPVPGMPDAGTEGVLEDILVRGNRIVGAEGLGILVQGASNSRIEDNIITGIRRRDPFPGLTWDGFEQRWEDTNGSAIWISPDSDGNEVSGNTFEDVAAFAVVVEGDSNRVALDDPAADVRDVGTGNRLDRFADVYGVRLHYLDFGGDGLPLVFVHSESWDARTYEAFAPRFADQNRVLAVTRPGYGESNVHPDGFDVATQARSLIDFLDALDIKQAVFAGNASATAELTFLGEHHADRVAGLIYFTGLAVPWLEEHDSDPTRAFEMFRRASPGAGDAAERTRARNSYRPEFLRTDQPTITAPTLAFVARSGTMGNESGIGALALVGSPLMEDVRSQMPTSPVRDHLERLASDERYRARQLDQIADPEARNYFLRLAGNRELQERMFRYHEDVVVPAIGVAQDRFRRAFADDLRIVRLDVDQVVGYEYRDAPELIGTHIRRFLEEVARSEGFRVPRHGNRVSGPEPAARGTAPESATIDSVKLWLESSAIPLHTVVAGNGLADMRPLKEVVGEARIVALGEPTHGNREVYQLKHRMLEFLVEELGFGVFVLETPMPESFDVNEYVRTGTGDPARALAGTNVWPWDTEEVLDMIEWMRRYNAESANTRKLRFYGFDMQSPERAARFTLGYLDGVDPPLAAATRDKLGRLAIPISDPEAWGYRPVVPDETSDAVRAAIDSVLTSFDARRDDWTEATSADEWALARQHARVLAQWVEANRDDGRRYGAVRDSAMAENIRWIVEREGTDAKIVVSAHNSHVADATARHRDDGSDWAGRHLRRMFGDDMVLFGFLFNQGGFAAIDAAVPSRGLRSFHVGSAPDGTVEAAFRAAGIDLAVVDLRMIPPGGAVAEWFGVPRPTRNSWGGYDAAAPGDYFLEYDLPRAFDALVFVDSTTPVRAVSPADYRPPPTLPAPANTDFEVGRTGEAPEGWFAWSKLRRFEFEVAASEEQPYSGSRSAMIRRRPGKHFGEASGSLLQSIDASAYRGRRIRLRAAARAELGDDGLAFLRLRINPPDSSGVHDLPDVVFDSLDEYLVTSPAWRVYEIDTEVPQHAAAITYGLFLAGVGTAWVDAISIEVVED